MVIQFFLNLGSSGSSYSYTGSGSIALSGSAPYTVAYNPLASGGITLGGSATDQATYQATASGSITLTGSAVCTVAYTPASGGSIALSGSAPCAAAFDATGSGTIDLSGIGHATLVDPYLPSGGILLSGVTPCTVAYDATGSGSVILSGSASHALAYHATGSGSITLSGSAHASYYYRGSGVIYIGCTPDDFGSAFGSAYSVGECVSAPCSAIYNLPVFHNYYAYRERITIPRKTVASDLTNFPLLVSLTLDPHKVATGFDFTFEDRLHNTLNFQIENYDYESDTLTAWVEVPTVYANQDTPFYVYYYKPSQESFGGSNPWAVFENVYHLGEIGNGTANEYLDSAKANDGTGAAAQYPTQVTGQIFEAESFDGNEWITTGLDTISVTNPVTVSAWVNLQTTASIRAIYSRGQADGTTGQGWNVTLGHDGLRRVWAAVQTTAGIYTVFGVTQMALGSWYHTAAVWTPGTGLAVYLNGTLEKALTISDTTLVASAVGNQIGRRDTSLYYNGYLDELHTTGTALSAAWIKAEYQNQLSPSTFYVCAPAQGAIGLDNFLVFQAAYTLTTSGSIALTGSASHKAAYKPVASGSITLGGSAHVTRSQRITGSGGITLTGSAPRAFHFARTMSGGISLTGSAKCVVAYTPAASGSITLSGSASHKAAYKPVASGSISLSGTASAKISNFRYRASGSITLTGNATSHATYTVGTSGSIKLSGSATHKPSYKPVASGSIALGGSVGKHSTYVLIMSGGLSLSGSAAHKARYRFTPSGSITLSGSATYRPAYKPLASGSITLGGAAALHTFRKIGSGSIALGGSAKVIPAYVCIGSGLIRLASPLPPVLTGELTSMPMHTAKITSSPLFEAIITVEPLGRAPVDNGPRLTATLTSEPVFAGQLLTT